VTPLVVTLEPAIVAAEVPFMPEAGVTVPKLATTPPSTLPTTVRNAAAVEEKPHGQSAPGAETGHGELDAPPAPRPSTVYYTVHELDVYPTLRQPLNIDWKSSPEPGWLTVGLTVDETGVVEDAAVVGASPDREAEAALLAALRLARFTAALKDGRAVRSRIFLRVRLGAETLARRP
jgi:protein TonB